VLGSRLLLKSWLTFRDREESDRDDGFTVCTANIIVNVSNRYIQGIVLILTSCNRNGRLVAARNDWDKKSPRVTRILFHDFILINDGINKNNNELSNKSLLIAANSTSGKLHIDLGRLGNFDKCKSGESELKWPSDGHLAM
jgi:hypothetical protein